MAGSALRFIPSLLSYAYNKNCIQSRQKSDDHYKELLTVMKNDKSWVGKKIHDYGKARYPLSLLESPGGRATKCGGCVEKERNELHQCNFLAYLSQC